jgi:hypothetical protein
MRVIAVILGLVAVPAFAAPCPEGAPPPLPAPFANWAQPVAVTASADAAAAVAVPLGQVTAIALSPSATVKYAMKPVRAIKDGSFGGVIAFDVPAAGRYRLAMGSFAWVDVIEDGKSLPSLERDHSLPCVSKVLDFELKAGRHIVQLADDKTAATKLVLVKGMKPPAPPKPAAAQ